MSEALPVPTNDKDRQRLKQALAEITACMQRMDDEREHIKDITKMVEEEFEIKAKVTRKLASTMYKHNYADVQAEHEHFEFLYESLVEGRKVTSDTEAA
jgi:hypothetical protein